MIPRFLRDMLEDDSRSVIEKIRQEYPEETHGPFVDMVDSHLADMEELYGPSFLEYGSRVRKKDGKEQRSSWLKSWFRNKFQIGPMWTLRRNIAEHLEDLDPETIRSYPVFGQLDFNAYVDLNLAMGELAVQYSSPKEQDEILKCMRIHPYSLPLEVSKLNFTSFHEGEDTGAYSVRIVVPSPLEQVTDRPYRNIETFCKIFKDKLACDRSEVIADLLKRTRSPSPEALLTYNGEDYDIMLFEHWDNQWHSDNYAEQIAN